MSVLAVFITGLGPELDGYTDGPMRIVRDFFSELVTTTGIRFKTAHWDNRNSLLSAVDEINGAERILLAGISHGGHRAIEIADGKYGPVNRIDCLVAEDPKPPMGEHFFQWLFGWKYAPPHYADEIYCIRGSVGSPMASGLNVHNIQLPRQYHGWLGHGKIPAAPDVLNLLRMKAGQLTQ